MSDLSSLPVAFDWQHPLSAILTSDVRAVDHLEILARPSIARVIAAAGESVAVAAILGGMAGVRAAGPQEWIVLDDDPQAALPARLAERLGSLAFVLDAGDGEVCLRLSGPHCRRILAKGVGLDLHPDVFGLGDGGFVLCHAIRMHLSRTGDNLFEILAPRSYATSLLDALKRMGREFDLSVGLSG
ncbi:hypothetical protein BJF92_02750 [Rhizobium rhizosphaerae]|uniref:Sarcosine oxidase subunit gamma n=1 Tax=Xaviernesmea rhizosphaerae TaxID=1672749 RepID=A0A1Q9ACA3_9HYPH|nr:sarcosine oxidase subunit gamma family protein [Xaviernesmea rhizosphaerae]OLP52509.1 hypothetical protein BJF92_02750 [Xaviernesmea rhizosphaerae]